jgi:hypothetical protein
VAILYILRLVGILPMWVDTAWPDVPAELHDACFRSPRILEGAWAARWFATPGRTAFRWRCSETRCFRPIFPF